jgi:hypothetical protein
VTPAARFVLALLVVATIAVAIVRARHGDVQAVHAAHFAAGLIIGVVGAVAWSRRTDA